MAWTIYPHDPLREIAADVWLVRGVSSIPLHRNMVIVRRPNGDLILHSVVAMNEAGMQALTALGKPAVAIVPNVGHQLDARFYQERFPGLRVVCPAGATKRVGANVRLAGTVEETLPPLGWSLHKVPGAKIDEYVYEVPLASGGRLLITNDVLGNANNAANTLRGRILVSLATGLRGRLGIPRVFRWRLVNDLATVKRFVAALATIPDIRLLTVSHGDPVTSDVAGNLRAAAA